MSREDDEQRLIRRWLGIADDVIRRNGGKKGGEREEPGEKPAKPRPSRGSPSR